jgi:nitroreductase
MSGRGPSRAPSALDTLETVRTVRQIRQFAPDPIPDDVLTHLLRVARWTGSARNSQPWHFIVVTDPDRLHALSQLRQQYWIASAPLAIAIVLDGTDKPIDEAYDEGRLSERVLVAANALGYGGGVAWYGNADHQAEAKRILGIPAERTARSIVLVGRATSREDPLGRRRGGRKPLSELVSYERWGGSH